MHRFGKIDRDRLNNGKKETAATDKAARKEGASPMSTSRTPEILFQLEASAKEPLYLQIYNQTCALIKQGKLKKGDKMPSIRALSSNLCISHATAERAYLQLSVEGYIASLPRSGYVVQHIDTAYFEQQPDDNSSLIEAIQASRNKDTLREENVSGSSARYDFSFANLQAGSFPLETWRKLTGEVLYSLQAEELTRYPRATYVDPLCTELATYLSAARGVSCTPEQIVLANATQHALCDLITLFSADKHVVGMEEPGYGGAIDSFKRMGYKMTSLPTTHGADAFIESIRQGKPKLIFTTPSHQFPTGTVLPLEARIELLQWAHENNAYIIEDDACHEFRYNTRPIPSLQSLDRHNRVIYLGTFSKSLSPEMRVSYYVLPPKLLMRYNKLFLNMHPSVPWVVRAVLAAFIREGYLDKNIRRQVAANSKRHDLLVHCLQKEMGDRVSLSGIDAGMHLYVTVHNNMTQAQLLESARKQGVNVYSTKRYWFSKPASEDCVIIGFSAIALEDIPSGVKALKRAWFE